MIPFNKVYLSGNEIKYITDAANSGKLSGDGNFTKRCHEYFEKEYSFLKVLLTTSCTHALEMAALLLDIQPGDEVIVPSFTFVSTANAFALRGASIVFADSLSNNPNIDPKEIERLITLKTKAIAIVHYAGFACDMEAIMAIANKHQIPVVEDAAQAIDSYYDGKPLGSFGDLAAFSFHDTKNIICGEGGLLVINKEKYIQRAEIIREKGTNRTQFFKGEVDKYGWVDIGSSYLPSEINAAFLLAQLENLRKIQDKRTEIWNTYYKELTPLAENGKIVLPDIPTKSTVNGHLFYILCKNIYERDLLINHLKENGVYAVFHYLPLHNSVYFMDRYKGVDL
ncbi:MAG: dTDP-4-amino-4,6-dideoxygalactose transaminase, partial [Chitinophagales bacterium]